LTKSFGFCQSNEEGSGLTELDTLTKTNIYTNLEQQPTVIGGMHVLFKEAAQSIEITNTASVDESKVVVAFIVTTNRTISGQRVIKNITGTDAVSQFLGVINSFNWNAGLCNGQNVSSIIVLTLNVCRK